jgi:acetolactate synthase-1/2/3 large subunit
VPAERVIRKSDLRAAIARANATPGPYLVEVMVPHIEHVLPMIPVGVESWRAALLRRPQVV